MHSRAFYSSNTRSIWLHVADQFGCTRMRLEFDTIEIADEMGSAILTAVAEARRDDRAEKEPHDD